MRLIVSLSVLALVVAGCTSYSVRLYPDPSIFRVVDETLVLNDAEDDAAPPLAVLMRGDSVMVIGERRTTWEYEQDPHTGFYIVVRGSRRAFVPLTSLITNAEYFSLYGAPSTGSVSRRDARPDTSGRPSTPGGGAATDRR